MSDFLRFLQYDWYFAAPLLLLTFLGYGLVIWRLLLSVNSASVIYRFLPVFPALLAQRGIVWVLGYCRSRAEFGPFRLFVAGLENYGRGRGAVRQAIDDVLASDVLPGLYFLLPSILVVAKIATLFGLVVSGISMSGAVGPAGPIDPLFGVTMGLACGVPLVFAHLLFKQWAARFEPRLRRAAQDLVELVATDRS
jgi:hypothetical protein